MPKEKQRTKKCKIGDVLSVGTLAMIQATPMNETARTLVLAAIKKPLPDEAKTYEQIVEWIEENIAPPPPQSSVPAISSTVEYTYVEVGYCRYYARRQGSARYGLSPEEMDSIVRDAVEEGASLKQFVQFVRAALADKCQHADPQTDVIRTDYDDHETDNDADTDPEYRVTDAGLESRIIDWLRVKQPETYEEFSNR